MICEYFYQEINSWFGQYKMEWEFLWQKFRNCKGVSGGEAKTTQHVRVWESWTENAKYLHIGFRKYVFPRALEKYQSTVVQVTWWNALLLLPAAYTIVCSEFWYVSSWLSIADITRLHHSFKCFKPCNSKICSSNQKKWNSNLHSKFMLGSPIQLALLRVGQHYSSRARHYCCHAREDAAP